MIFFMCVGAALGTFLGALQPLLSGMGDFNGVPVLTAEYTMVGGTVGFALWNYLRARQRILRRIQEATHQDNVTEQPA